MDQATLVKTGQALVVALDEAGIRPRLAMWVHSPDTDTWKLWLVPPREFGEEDRRDFYRRVSQIISERRNELADIDASDTEMVLDTHPAVKGLENFLRVSGLGSVFFSGNKFNGYYLPDGIIIRSDL